MRKILSWVDTNLLAVISGFLLVFIPLYPKLPLFDIIYGYNVRVRAEDFFVAIAIFLFLIQFVRHKVRITLDPVSIGIFTYLFFGLASVLVAIFILQTVPMEYIHAGKTFLHWARRVEYFSLFFILFGSIKSLKTTKVFVVLIFVTLLLVTIYGYGQKYMYWPAFSTMNREFSKGWVLYLSEHARVLSTFGGHYDLAGYLVIALSLGWSFFFGLKEKLKKLAVGLLIAGGFWLLILTASRISFIAYLVGLTAVVFLWSFKKGLEWGISRLVVTVLLSIVIMLSFGDLSDRFLRVLRLDERVSGLKNIVMKPTGPPPQNRALFLDNTADSSNIANVTSKSDQPPTPGRPGDVSGNEEPLLIREIQPDGSVKLVPKTRSYSSCALKYDLSTCIRLEVTWPRAIEAWKQDPFLGTGYATLSKAKIQDFTEAESTDGDFFRALGETGTLGFLAFYGTILLMVYFAFRALGGVKDNFLYSLTAGFVGLCLGLFANAALIDIFESSKVAYIFWGVSGLTLGSLYLYRDKIKEDREPMRINFDYKKRWDETRQFFLSDRPWVAIILVVGIWLHTYKINTPLADWHSWRQADTSAVTRNFIKQDRINWLYPTYDDLSSVASGLPNPLGYRFVEVPIYNAATVLVRKIVPELTIEAAGRMTTALASAASALFLFLIVRQLLGRRTAYLTALTFTLLPYNLFYGRTILPDPSMVATSLGAIYTMLKYLTRGKGAYLVLSAVLAAVAMLIKPYAIFLLAPIAYLWYQTFGLNVKIIIGLLGYWVIIVAPFLAWRYWISQFPEGIPANSWLLNGDGIRFKGAFWYWLFADRIGRLILGYWGLVLLAFGLVGQKENGKYSLFPLIFLVCSLSYLFVFATGNVRHDYYQILIVPSLTIFVGMGLNFLLTNNSITNNLITKILAVICFVFMLAFGWYFVKDFFNINHPEIAEAGKAVDELTPRQAKVISPYDGDTAFLYQTNRGGWPLLDGTIDDLIKKGAHYYVSVKFDDLTNELVSEAATPEMQKLLIERNRDPKRYTLVKKTNQYAIVQLVPDKLLPKN